MKFSIIVPVYNAQEYLQDCCDSVLYQSYQDFELILVDDGSTDYSATLCDRISNRFPERCIAVHTVNQGPLLARQAGIREATGDVLIFLDSDDCIREDTLYMLKECFERYSCDMVLFNYSTHPDYLSKDSYYLFSENKVDCVIEKQELYRSIVSSRIPNGIVLKAVRKRCIESLPNFAEISHVKNGEDLLLSLYMITSAKRIVYLDETLYFYRQRENSIVHTYNPDRVRSISTVHKELERFIDVWGMPELHSTHYARVVRSWMDTLLILMDNRDTMDSSAFYISLEELANDEFFRHAFASMERKSISREYRLLAGLLYHRCYWCLRAACQAKTVKNSKRGR